MIRRKAPIKYGGHDRNNPSALRAKGTRKRPWYLHARFSGNGRIIEVWSNNYAHVIVYLARR